MKKVLKAKSMKIVAATAMTIFSLFAAVAGVFAWFTSKLSESASAPDFGVYHDDSQITTLSCYAIKYDGVYGAQGKKIVSGQDHSMSMSEYDSIFTDKNVNTPLFFRIELTGFNTSKDLQISIPCTGSHYVTNQTYVDNFLSNVVCAKFSYGLTLNGVDTVDNYELTGDTVTNETIKTIYTGMRDHVRNQDGTPFVKSESQKDSEIKLSLPAASLYQSSNIIQKTIDGETVDVVVIYVAFDYYVTNTTNLVEKYMDSYDGSGIDCDLNFEPDIGAMVLRDVAL